MINNQIIINDLLINYYSVIPGRKTSGKTLIFLHGWGVDSQIWLKVIPELSKKNWSMYFLDLPGFGLSQIPGTTYGIDDYKSVIYEFISKLGLKKIVLIGHSFGGSIGIKIASEDPAFLDKLILVNAAGIRNPSKRKSLKSTFAKVISPIFSPSFMQPLRLKFYQLIGSEYLNIPAMSKIFSKVVSEDITFLLSKINKPTLVISGDTDMTTPVEHAKLMSNKIKGSKLVVLSAGHFSFLDEPEEFAKELVKFIE